MAVQGNGPAGKTNPSGQLPPFVEAAEGHFFDIRYEQDTINYETKWAPNTATLVEIADHFQTDFVYEYYEPGMCIFGEATYQKGMLTDISLNHTDFELFEWDEKEGYRFGGHSYETDMEILEILLERKKTGPYNPRGLGR